MDTIELYTACCGGLHQACVGARVARNPGLCTSAAVVLILGRGARCARGPHAIRCRRAVCTRLLSENDAARPQVPRDNADGD
jgi:hypothetical protein